MSRFRLALAALGGILITTGGCTGSATAPEAATARGASASQKSDKADVAEQYKPAGDDATTEESGDQMTTQGGFILGGG